MRKRIRLRVILSIGLSDYRLQNITNIIFCIFDNIVARMRGEMYTDHSYVHIIHYTVNLTQVY